MSQKWYENPKYKKGKKKTIPQESTLEDKLTVLPLYDYIEHEGKIYFRVRTALGEQIFVLPKETFFQRYNEQLDFIKRNFKGESERRKTEILYSNLMRFAPSIQSQAPRDVDVHEPYLEWNGGANKIWIWKEEEEPKSELEKVISVEQRNPSRFRKAFRTFEERTEDFIDQIGKEVLEKIRHKKSDENE